MKLLRLFLPVLALVASPLFGQSQVNLATQVKGVLPVANGGTSGTTGATARSGIGAAASGSNTDITTLNPSGGIQVGSPTGGAKGTGTLNAGGLYVNGSTVGTVTSIATSGLVSGGTITGTGTISLSNIGSGDVVGNSTASSAAPADTTLTAIIDQAIGSTQGQILYRNSSAWTTLSAGTSGQVLQTGGTGANPSWTTPASGTVTVSGTPTTGNCAKFSSATQITDAGAACGSGGGGSGALTLITETVTSGTASSVTFSSISSSYRDLEVRVRGRATSTSGWIGIGIQFNSDTGSNYRYAQYGSNSQSQSGPDSSSSATSYRAGFLPDANALSNASGAITMDILNYRDTTFHKSMLSRALYMTGTAATSYNQADVGGAWISTSAITSVKVFPLSGAFVDGDVVSLYGRM